MKQVFFEFVILLLVVTFGLASNIVVQPNFSANTASQNTISRAGTVTFTFYDRSGNLLTYSQAQDISMGTAGGWENDCLIAADTLELLELNPLDTSLELYVSEPSFFAMNWEVMPNGFVLLIIDHEGSGLVGGETINFTFQAAKDMRRRLDTSVTSTGWSPSATFLFDYNNGLAHLAAAEAGNDATMGAEGYLALDDLTLAYDTYLREFGIVNAIAHKETTEPQIAFTIDRTDDYQARIDLVVDMAAPYDWIRVYFDTQQTVASYSNLLDYAHTQGVSILGQPVDSTDAAGLSTAEYVTRFEDYYAAYPYIDVWEVGNEVNGSWLPADIDQKVIQATDYIDSVGGETYLCLFWQINTDDVDYDLFKWIQKLPQDTRSKLDYVAISIYVEQAPLGADALDLVMGKLRTEFPSSEIGIAELDYWIPDQRYWWAYDETDPIPGAMNVVLNQYYRAGFAWERAFSGCYWWNYWTEFPDPAREALIQAIRTEILNGVPSTPMLIITKADAEGDGVDDVRFDCEPYTTAVQDVFYTTALDQPFEPLLIDVTLPDYHVDALNQSTPYFYTLE